MSAGWICLCLAAVPIGFFGLIENVVQFIITYIRPPPEVLPEVIPEVKLTVPISMVQAVGISPNACKQPVGTSNTVEWAYNHITRFIAVMGDYANRRSMIVISRCPRGGKTTILRELHEKLRENNINVISVSFNGISGFQRLRNETPCESLFRVITNQLDVSISETSRRVTDWKQLDDHIGDEQFVLLIDEINVLCSVIGSELARVLKLYFLDKVNRHIVVTSHQPFLSVNNDNVVGKFWSDSVAKLSDRSLTLVPMPVCYTTVELVGMDAIKCSSLTRSKASFYGGMPSLMYSVCMQIEESPSVKFSTIVQGISHDNNELLDFVEALLTGVIMPSLKQYYCFTSDVQFHEPLGIVMKWPLCYVACILRRYKSSDVAAEIVKCIEVLESDCDTVGDGMVWEQSTRIAILLRFIAASMRKWSPPFQLCGSEEARDAAIRLMSLGTGITTVEQAKDVIKGHAKRFPQNTLVLFVPTQAEFAQFDGFCVRYNKGEVCNVSGYQCKANNNGADGTVPDWITQGGHLLRSAAPKKCKSDGPNVNHWTYYNEKETDDFLGWSLQTMRAKTSIG